MAATIVAPRTRILTGPGVLLRAPIGSLVPGQTSYAVTNRAVASNVATLTVGTHTLTVGKQAIVSIGEAALDGLVTVTAIAATTFSYAVSSADVTSGSVTGTAVTWDAGGTVSGGIFTDAWPASWTPVGVTKDGTEFTWTPSTGNIEVAESLLPLRVVTESVEGSVTFAVAEFTARNLAWALNGGTVRTVSGTGATLLSELTPPDAGSETRTMIGWQSDDLTERAVFFQCLQGGDVSINNKKGTDNAAIGVEFQLEQPAVGKPFKRWYAGTTPIGA